LAWSVLELTPGILIVIIIILILAGGSYTANSKFAGDYKEETGKLAVRNHLNHIHRNKMKPNIEYIEQMGKDLLNLKKLDAETETEFLKRIEDYVRWTNTTQ
jgi:hypothetical protein